MAIGNHIGDQRVAPRAPQADLSAPCELLDWDTDFWDFPIARAREYWLTPERAAVTDEWCLQRGVRCLYFLARADDGATTRAAEDHHFRLVDVRLTFACVPGRALERAEFPRRSNLLVREHRASDLDALARIARVSYRDTRFYADPSFPRERCDDLYETWIRRSCDGYAETVLVAECAGEPAGYVTGHLSDQGPEVTGQIGLVGVSARARGQGIGLALIEAALQWFVARGAARVSTVTQGRNLVAQRLYQRSGFQTSDLQLWYHKWYSVSEAEHA